MEWIIAPLVIGYYCLALTYALIVKHEPEPEPETTPAVWELRGVVIAGNTQRLRQFQEYVRKKYEKKKALDFDWRKEGF